MSVMNIKNKWFRWSIAAVIILALLVLSIVVWNAIGKPKVDASAELKAKQLYDLATSAGLDVPSVETLVNIYGNDGGYGVEVAEGTLAKAVLTYNLARTGEVTQRPIIADPKFLQFQLLVIKVYRPTLYRDTVLPYIKGLNFDQELPAWLQADLADI
ncbi:MAG: hypothetical protein A2V52_07500 [Actinobacteria bacterium RBG_19FT_COMBO_54_7]|uniref:Uncharacterized protein n=1 Tax=Candidatus Solincola sediminis TaxID=1797199 RepID=A0A1F2WI82_9ACTN|nr:MAG: hypothetical protein A2Y75_01085 [Candidatus Solincola sediminis]OFW57197.1 MAG: hypothetical protein A2W01_00680 [Candidatus Solincola sediminis]OFW66229.1 MAG: hypothetical protein A2V52_07500 [Actinobacteria bacterium RBG_19FT_COMBO_54_7]